MPSKELIVDPAGIDLSIIVADLEAIRRQIPQRDAMEQLTAIVMDDAESQLCIGYRDLSSEEFWVSGHMPGMPLMPGVMMCEMAAQVSSYFARRHNLLGSGMIGFGGLDNVRFRGMVRPGDRLVMVCQVAKVRRGRLATSQFQGFVENKLVCEGTLNAVPLPKEI